MIYGNVFPAKQDLTPDLNNVLKINKENMIETKKYKIKDMPDSDFAFLEEILDIKHRSVTYKEMIRKIIQTWLDIIVRRKLIEWE